MQKPSEFVHAYLHALTPKEVGKLKALLQADEKQSELKLVDILLAEKSYHEPVVIKNSGYTKKSFQKFKSDLKRYMLSTGGYQTRILNQAVLESIGIAQGLLKRGFFKEGNEELDKIATSATEKGANLYAIVALGLKGWSVVFNQHVRFNTVYPLLQDIEKRLHEELTTVPIMTFSMMSNDVIIHDAGLRRNESKVMLQQMLTDPLIKEDCKLHSTFNQWLILIARSTCYTLSRDFKNAIVSSPKSRTG